MRKIILLMIIFLPLSFFVSIQGQTTSQPVKTPTPQKTPTSQKTPTPQKTPTSSTQQTQDAKNTTTQDKNKKTSSKSTKKTTTKAKSTTKKGARKSPSKSKKSGSAFSTFTMQINPDIPVLYFDPSDCVAELNKTFENTITFTNPKSKSFDKIVINIKYNPELLKCTGIGDNSWILKNENKKNLVTKLISDKGLIIIQAEFNEPIVTNEQKILTLQWEPLALCNHTSIDFISTDEMKTQISGDGFNILGETGKKGEGLLGVGVSIRNKTTMEISDLSEEELLYEDQNENYAEDLIFDNMPVSDSEKYQDVQLAMITEKPELKVGEESIIYLYLMNPDRAPIDQINLLIRYDSKSIKVVDYDEENWITLGDNIFDGIYHEKFPFDYHIDNSVNAEEGTILYRVGLSTPDIFPSKGIFAEIHIKAIAENPEAKFTFLISESKKIISTSVAYMGNNLLLPQDINDDKENLSANVHNLTIKVKKD